jgi:hypothetical protein
MELIEFEARKILHRRYSLILLIGTTILFPAILKILSYLNTTEDNTPEGLFAGNLAFSIITYTQTYFFLPLWIIVFVGNELSHGHVNRVAFCKSRHFYFAAKLIYCGMISFFFSLVGLITLLISIKTSPYTHLQLSSMFYADFFAQLFFSSLSFALLLLCLVFFIRSPLKTFIVYFIWSVVEGIIYTVFDKLLDIKMNWLPLHLVRTFYSINGKLDLDNYYHPLMEDLFQVIPAVGFIFILTFFTYRTFIKSNLPMLSD